MLEFISQAIWFWALFLWEVVWLLTQSPVIILFIFLIPYWISFGSLCLSRNFSISSSLSNLLAYNFSPVFPMILFIFARLLVMFLPFLILVFWDFSIFFLASLTKGCQYCWSFQRNSFWFCSFSLLFSYSLFYLFLSIFFISFFPVYLGLVCSSFYSFLRWKFRLLFEILFFFNICVYSYNFPLITCLLHHIDFNIVYFHFYLLCCIL